jgi:hypothetical protein
VNVRSRIALLVQAQGARRAAGDIDDVAGATRRVGDRTERAGRQIKKADVEASRWHKSLRATAKAAKIGAVAATGLALAVGKHSIDEFRDAARVNRATQQTLHTMGGQANVTAKDVSNLANSISLKAGIDDEAIQKGENVLLTFKAIRNEVGKGNAVFNQAAQAATDLAAAKHKDVASTAEMLGKALQEPATGAAALKRVGSLAAADLEHLKKMAEDGVPVLQQQKFVLLALQKQYGGQAAAQTDAFQKTGVAVDNLAESLGYLIGPPLMRAAQGLAHFVQQMTEGRGAGGKFRRVLVGAGHVLGDIFAVAKGGVAVMVGLVRAFQDGKPAAVVLGMAVAGLTAGFIAYRTAVLLGVLATAAVAGPARAAAAATMLFNLALEANPIVLIVTGLAALGAAFVIAYKKVGWFRHGVQAVWGWIKGHWPLLLSILTGPIGTAVIYIVRHWDQIKAAATGVWHWVRDRFNDLVGFFTGMPGRIAQAASGMWDGITDAFKAAVKWIVDKINWIVDKLQWAARKAADVGGFLVPGGSTGLFSDNGLLGIGGIPGLASGGQVRGNGAFITGESGPELNTIEGGRVRVQPLSGGEAGGGFADAMRRALEGMVIEQHLHQHAPNGRETTTTVRRVALRDLLAESPA